MHKKQNKASSNYKDRLEYESKKCKKVTPEAFPRNNLNKLVLGSILLLVLSLAAELIWLVDYENHHFEFEGYRFFYAAMGFLSCVTIVIVSKILGFILKRQEDYYQS